MSEWMVAASTVATAVTTVFIARFTRKTYEVYSNMSEQIGEQIQLTRDIFLESHKPMLSVSIKKCEYSESEGVFTGYIRIKNYGSAVANETDLTFSFGGTNFIKRISRIAIRPKDKISYPFSFEMTANQFAAGQVEGNRINALIQGSYKGIADRIYSYNERQDFYPDLNRFTPVIAT
jgi:hypothetical protein